MKFGLEDKILEDLISIFSSIDAIDEVLIYGSRAKGNYKEGSDIDLTFKGLELNLEIMNNISIKIDNLNLPYTFDLSIFHQIKNNELTEHIDRVGILLYNNLN